MIGTKGRQFVAISLPAFLISIGIASAQPTPLQRVMATLPGECEPAIASAEQSLHLPPGLLNTVAIVESGRFDPISGRVSAWPWTINVEGTSHLYRSKAEAVAAVQDYLAQGVRSIDVGCMQINLQQHPAAFRSVYDAFDPVINSAYGAHFIDTLYRRFGTWEEAIAAYHSQTVGIGEPYRARVMALWPLGPVFGASGRGPGRAPSTAAFDSYTPEFAAFARRMEQDRARLDRQFADSHAMPAMPIRSQIRTWPRVIWLHP